MITAMASGTGLEGPSTDSAAHLRPLRVLDGSGLTLALESWREGALTTIGNKLMRPRSKQM